MIAKNLTYGGNMGILKCSHLFTDNMVLQRRKNIKVWGFSDIGSKITVSINGITAKTKATTHEWMVILPPMEAGGPFTLEVSDDKGDKLEYSNVMIGEVWIAGGQSNMEFELQNSLGGKEILENIKGTNVRFFYVKKNAIIDEYFYHDERNNSWMEASAENSKIWSAVGFHFAKKLSDAIGVTVGVIGCNWGGTSASAWMSKEMLASDIDTKAYLDDYDKIMEGKTYEQYLEELEEYAEWYKNWQPKIDEFYRNNPDGGWDDAQAYAGLSRWPGPMGPKSEYRPSGLYETMFKRVVPYSLAGAIYYQGESDDHRPEMYYKLLRNLITQWRLDFEDDLLPFIPVQLPMHRNKGAVDTYKWSRIREAQMRVHQTVANTGIAVATDCGEFNNIHPIDKKPVGERLSLQAMHHVYGIITADEAYGPIYKSCVYNKDNMLLEFDYVKDGFMLKDGKTEGFEIAGCDKVYHKADVQIVNNQILVSAADVKYPMYARYLWTDYSEVYIYGKNGLPLAPFRTSMNDN
jgi:sialate O-acetylesterase